MLKTRNAAGGGQNPSGNELKTPTRHHNAMFGTFLDMLDGDIQRDDIELQDEHRLSADALRIDIIIIKKKPGVEIKRVWGKFMRRHNILEYKSPAVPAPSLRVFNKVVHGYAGIYAAQHNVWLTDMTATIICAKKPVRLFKILEKYYNYEILAGDPGIYYIRLKGVPIEETLAVQVMVCPELPDSEFMLKALMPGIDEDTAKKVLEILNGGIGNNLNYWAKTALEKNLNAIIKAGEIMKEREVIRILDEYGYGDFFRQKWRQEGWQEGEQEGWQKGRQEGEQKGRQEGELEGWQKGLEAEKRRTAGVMLADGMDVDTIARITGLTVGEISKLQPA